jgi:hypothetical protein
VRAAERLTSELQRKLYGNDRKRRWIESERHEHEELKKIENKDLSNIPSAQADKGT